MQLDHLQRLEAESIHVIREVVATCARPVILYSLGKDSAVLLHLARKAFFPGRLPLPLLHVDTTWKFREMIQFRERLAQDPDLDIIVHINEKGVADGISPLTHDSGFYTYVMKTLALRQALEKHRFDAAFGGARRDEEKSRAKERVVSFRTAQHGWNPRRQRPELWRLYNTYVNPGESLRIFPLSNWTELDVWRYIARERIELPSLYFAKPRPTIRRNDALIVVDDARLALSPGELVETRQVRFRTLGCYPLTGAIESTADTLESIIDELLESKRSERQGRVIDREPGSSMEDKKREGYF
jgi:sulfate adenylyltransferase subunit 2